MSSSFGVSKNNDQLNSENNYKQDFFEKYLKSEYSFNKKNQQDDAKTRNSVS